MTPTSMRPLELNDAHKYQNPLRYVDGQEHTNPDPFGFQYRGRYYCVATDERGVKGSWSDDLVLWHDAGYILQITGRSNYWAPCVTYAEGHFYMYFSCAPQDSSDPHDEHLMVATATDPMGPYRYQHTFFDSFSIDPHVVRGDDGNYYMFYSTNDQASADERFIGTSIFVDKLDSFEALEGKPRPVVFPSLPEEMFEENRFGDGRDWYTVEGASYFRRRNRAYVTYSGNAYIRENYFVGYSRALIDGAINELEWTKYPSATKHAALIKRSDAVEGTGHNSIVVGPNLVDSWILYHGRDAADELDFDREQRTMRMDPLYFDGDKLDTPAPTALPCLAPAAPLLADYLPSGFTSVPMWGNVEGDWRAARGEVSTSVGIEHRLLSDADLGCYRAQVWVAANSDEPSTGLRIGFVAYDAVDKRVTIWLDLAGGVLVAECRDSGSSVVELGRATVEIGDASAFRLLEVQRGPRQMEIRLDGLTVLTVPAPRGGGAVGLVSRGDAARFSAFVVTEHVDLWGEGLAAWGDYYEADREILHVVGEHASELGLEGIDGAVVFVSKESRASSTTVHDFDVYDGRDGRVVFSAYYVCESDRVTVEVHQGVARIVRVTANGTTQISEVSGIALNFSVRCGASDGQLMLRVGGETVVVAVGHSAFAQRIEIAGARVCGVEITNSASSNQRKEEQ